jgi:hypothetical protein
MRSNIQVILVLLVCAVCGSVGVSGAGETQPDPGGFWVEEARLDIGDVSAGNEVVGTFIFHNDGETDVKIIRAKPS